MLSKKEILIMVLFGFLMLVLLGCSDNLTLQAESERDQLIVLEGVRISVKDALLRNSFQNYYLMQYPEPDHVFLEVTLTIDNLSATPDVILDWGEKNFHLDCSGTQPDLTVTRRMIINEVVKYKSGEELDFYYVYIFTVPQKMDFDTCGLVFSNGQHLSLAPILPLQDYSDSEMSDSGFVLSGSDNQVRGEDAVVAGGARNIASAIHTTISGGDLNAATASHATIGGGRENIAEDFYTTIGGGYANTASARDSFVGGGSRNTAGAPRSTVGGGLQNQALASDTIIAGGAYNQVGDDYAAITGGTRNIASGYASVIGGGAGNQATNDQSAIVGGLNNQIRGKYSFIGGGYGNLIRGDYAMIPGGFQNWVAGSYSFAAGNRAQIPADHDGTFVFADASGSDFYSTAANEFAVRATGGVRFVTAVDADGGEISGVRLLPGSGTWSTLSDINTKADFETLDPQAILIAVSELPISTWRYQNQADSFRHIGPMAQDFYAAFGLGEDPRYISTIDADGVALTSIQGLYQLIQWQQAQIQVQESYMLDLETRLQAVEQNSISQQKSQPGFWVYLGWGLFFVLGIWSFRKK